MNENSMNENSMNENSMNENFPVGYPSEGMKCLLWKCDFCKIIFIPCEFFFINLFTKGECEHHPIPMSTILFLASIFLALSSSVDPASFFIAPRFSENFWNLLKTLKIGRGGTYRRSSDFLRIFSFLKMNRMRSFGSSKKTSVNFKIFRKKVIELFPKIGVSENLLPVYIT